MGLLDDKLVVIDHHIAKIGGQINHTRRKGHIVDGLAQCHHGILDFGHVHDRAIRFDDINIGIGVHHDEVILVAVVVNLLNDHIGQVIDNAQRLVFIGLLVESEQITRREVVNPVLSIGHSSHVPAKCRVELPVTNGILGASKQGCHHSQ